MQTGPIFMLSGSPGSGKSSAARALALLYPFGMHIPLDDMREWVVSGIAHPVPTWTDETTRQFHLARGGAGRLARLYAEAGFAVILDDVIFPPDFEKSIAPQLAGLAVVRVLLLPDEAVAQQRNRERNSKNFDYSFLVDTIRELSQAMRAADFGGAGWHVIDNSRQSLEETVSEINNLIR